MKMENGFTMIEVMISLVILTIAVLAIASADIAILGQSAQSANRLKAVTTAENMIEMVRRNNKMAAAYNFNVGTDPVVLSGVPTMAEIDRQNWQVQIQQAIPGMIGTVATGLVAGVSGMRVTVTIGRPVPAGLPPDNILTLNSFVGQ
ncbi:MAG: prepilin-type N-terminal cleavage/methylation domain-containing protein [Nitrospirota bacterium]